MQVRKIKINNQSEDFWIVVGSDYLPIKEIDLYLKYLLSTGKSPNTIRSYAYHLKELWLFLADAELEWDNVGLVEMSKFINWLKVGYTGNVMTLSETTSLRSEKTINTIVTAVISFYDYHSRLDNTKELQTKKANKFGGKNYKSFLHHISNQEGNSRNILKIKEPKRIPKTLTTDQVKNLIKVSGNRRDKFLISLLYETGMRIGEALGLKHEDIQSWDKVIQVIPRKKNENNARAKSDEQRTIDVSTQLIQLYTDYVVYDFDEIESDYVFVNIWGENVGKPLTYSTVYTKFRRLAEKHGIPFSPHIFRHTHATELLRSGWDASYVQKRLGHKDIQTTINTYAHLDDQDLKQAFQKFQKDKK
ncbi:site-specific integrase [Vibrio pelagius]|uniref:site-specific integrase n=1 Tax=Vibrio pelagius TaxID=28169 RepID=UPI0021C3D928|nr:site-specific integrase [Vibrio pelagius]